jgi:O-antigen/teichoic acid export membrane protein
MGIQFLSVMILARVLSPSEIGTFSLAAMLMTMLHVFRDFGVAQYVIQERDLSFAKLQSTMGVAILLALFAGGVLFGLSGPVSRFYGNPELRKVMLVMSASFVISPFGSVVLGVLRRQNQLAAIFYVKTASAVCHVTVAVGLALHGAGAISLAWANFTGILTFGVVGNLLRPAGVPWLPRFNNMRDILSFGSVSSMGNLANIAGTSTPELIVGKVLNMAAVGYFSRATGLVQLFSRLIANALTPLVLPYFAQMRRDGRTLGQPYLLAVSQLTAVAWPFFAVLLVLAYPVTRTLYGAQWDASVPVARLLCLSGAIAAVGLFATQAMVAVGQVRSSTTCNVIVQPVRIVAVLLATRHGLLAIAAVLLLVECAGLAVTSWFLRRTIGVGPAQIARACAKSAVITACSVAVPVLVWLILRMP